MIIVFGASGLLGSAICSFLKTKNRRFIGFSKSKKDFKKINLLNKKNIIKVLDKIKPQILINCTGLTDVDECNKNIEKAYMENSLTAKNIVESLNFLKMKSYLIHISTDQVYNSSNIFKLNNEENENLNNIYSITKFIGEKNTLDYKNSLILRTNFFGQLNSRYKISYSNFIINNLKNKKKIKLPVNVIFNPVDINFLSSSILRLCDLRIKGVYNLGAKNLISKYNFGILIAKKFNLEKKFIKKFVSRYEIHGRPLGTYMSTKKISKYLKLPTIQQCIDNLDN